MTKRYNAEQPAFNAKSGNNPHRLKLNHRQDCSDQGKPPLFNLLGCRIFCFPRKGNTLHRRFVLPW